MQLSTAKRLISSKALQLWLLILRQEIKFTGFYLSHLVHRNQRSTDSAVAASGPVVSVTSHGDRLDTVHLVLESIAAGSARPSRLILWVNSAKAIANRSDGLKRLVERGLEIRLSENFGPHTKYYPYLLSAESFASPLVTADDDVVYSKWWLEGLARSHRENPDAINCYRAHLVRLAGSSIGSYQTWTPCNSTYPSYLHFATGVSGCIYPPAFLSILKAAGPGFLELCPKSDDVWLHAHAVRAGIVTRQIWCHPLRFPSIPGSQRNGLYRTNILLARNDEQIRKTYEAADIAMLETFEAKLHRSDVS